MWSSLLQVLNVLASASDQRSIENELVLSLGFEQFELIKELIKNRLRIVWCTKLSRAQVIFHICTLPSNTASLTEFAQIVFM